MPTAKRDSHNTELLFFIIIFLLLFYDSRPLAVLAGHYEYAGKNEDSSILFFILIFLLLFY